MAENSCSKIKSLNTLKEVVAWGLICFVLSVPFLRRLESQTFHGDENYWLKSSKYFKLFFIDRDFSNKEWTERMAYEEPPVGGYIIGLALSVFGYGDKIQALGDMNRWVFLEDYDWNVAQGALPPEEILYVARLAIAILGSLTCLMIYWIGKSIFGVRAGLIAALLLAYNPLMLSYGRRAMTDVPLLFFLTANVVLMIFFYQSLLKKKILQTFVFSALTGVNIALAAGTKLSGVLAAIIFVSFCMLIVFIKAGQPKLQQDIIRSSKEIKITLISLLIAGVIAIFVFVVINPYLYHQPLKGMIYLVKYRIQLLQEQPGLYGIALTSLSQKFSFVMRIPLLPGNQVILGNIFKSPVAICLFLLASAMLLYGEVKYILKNYRASLRSIIFIWIAVTFFGIIVWIPIDWDRYCLPLVPCVAMMIGYGIDKIIAKIISR